MAATFNPEMLILARESRGYAQIDFSSEMDVAQGTLSKIESGQLQPPPEFLDRAAEKLDYPIGFFFQPDQVYGFNSTVFFHRKRQSLPDRHLRRLHAQMNINRMRVDRLLRSTEINTQGRFRRIELSEYRDRPDTIAQIVRSEWLLPPGPVRNVVRAIEDAGGVVMRLDFGTKQADAISEWIPPFPPIFLINSSSEITGDRLRLTLAHEIGHVVMHRFASSEMEKQANSFAAEFLMPRKQIKPSLYSLSFAKLADLKAEWKVSMAALIQRALELGTITESQRKYLFINLGKRGYRLREPEETDVPLEYPEVFNELLEAHVSQLRYSREELAALLLIRNQDELAEDCFGERRLRRVI